MNIKIIDLQYLGHPRTIAAFLIESSEGPVLIETGPHATLPQLEAGLKKEGYKLDDVQHVLLTHIHLDHAGAAWCLAERGANIYLHPFGVKHLADPSRLMASAKRIYQDQMDRLWGQMKPIAKEQLLPVSNEQIITIGDLEFKAWHTPGHAVHHIAWQIGNELIGGDVTGVQIGGGPIVPPCPPPDINIEDWKHSLELIRQLRLSKIYLVHFGVVEQVEDHLNGLEAQLNNWSMWMKPYAEQQTDSKEIVPLFQSFVKAQLRSSGLNEEDIQQYENANPAWMSVAGLMRYWKKKWERQGT